MTLQELEMQRDDVCTMMIEAEGKQLTELQRELEWIEELISELEFQNGKEN